MPKKKTSATSGRKRDSRMTRTALLAAGEKLFAQKGFSSVTLDEIAASSKANKAMIAYYFGSKAGLYDAIVEAAISALIAEAMTEIGDAPDPETGLKRFIRTLGKAHERRITFSTLLLREYLDGRMQEREQAFKSLSGLYRVTERLYHEGKAAGRFRDVDPHMLHLSIVGALVFFLLTSGYRTRLKQTKFYDLTAPSFDAYIDFLQHMVVAGLRPPAPVPAGRRKPAAS